MRTLVMPFFMLASIVLFGLEFGFAWAQSGTPSFQNRSDVSGGMEVLPGGFRRFRDANGTPGILQRTPDSGFPNSQFIAPIAPALAPSSPNRDVTPPVMLSPPGTLQQNVPLVPGTQIPQSPFILPGANR